MIYSAKLKWELWFFRIILNNTLPSSFEILKLLVYCYTVFFHLCITNFNMYTPSLSTWARYLVAFNSWNVLLHRKNYQLFSSRLWMWSSSQIYEIKSSCVLFYAHAFSLLNNELNFETDLFVEADMMSNIMMSSWEEIIK